MNPFVALTVWSRAVLAQHPGGAAYPLARAGRRLFDLFPMKEGRASLLIILPPVLPLPLLFVPLLLPLPVPLVLLLLVPPVLPVQIIC